MRNALDEIAATSEDDKIEVTAADLLEMLAGCNEADKKAIMHEMVKEVKIKNADRMDNGHMTLDIEVTYN